jgi:hypothetical protein
LQVFKVLKLTELKAYKTELDEKIRSYLYAKADGTILWVALFCKELQGVQVRRTLSVLEKFPALIPSHNPAFMKYTSPV